MNYRLVIAGCLALGILGCGPEQGGDRGASEGDVFKVALLTPGSITDAGWNALAYKGLMDIKEEFGAEVRHVETKTLQEHAPTFRKFARDGYDLVIGHGFEYQDAAARVAEDFPDTVFITTSGNTVRQNMAPIVFCMEEATYLLGIVSARMSASGKLGLLGGMEIPSIESSFETFEMGAKSVRPDVTVKAVYTGSFEDVVRAAEATRALVDQGYDFIFHNADAAGRGMFQVLEQTQGVYGFGSNADQNDLAPDATLASAVIRPEAFTMVARWVHDKTFEPKVTVLDMRNGALEIVWNPRLKDRIPEAVMAEYEAVRERIFASEIHIPIKFLENRGS